jgi:ADP-ribosyl-[dinitrogen reductase] hydrolase
MHTPATTLLDLLRGSSIPPSGSAADRDNTLIERTLGGLLGGAVGDAFGYAVEFDSLRSIRARFGKDGIRAPVLDGGRLLVSDDTQMTLFTLEALLDLPATGGRPNETSARDRIRDAYLDWYHTQAGMRSGRHPVGRLAFEPTLCVRRAPGTTCLSALAQGGNGSIAAPINDSKGCGGVMRVAPIGLFPDRYDAEQSFHLGAEAAALTHGHPSGYLSAGVLAAIVRHLIDGADLVESTHRAIAFLPAWHGHGETLSAVEGALALAADRPSDQPTAVRALGEGWVAEEALAIGLYAALVAPTYVEALIIAANHDGDSDSTASIAGQLWGACHGVDGIPHDWALALDVVDPLVQLVHRRQQQILHSAALPPDGES